MAFQSWLTQWWPPTPAPLTEENLPSQTGKVFIVTGGNSGVGFELINTLYPSGATIYMACRSREKAEQAIEQIKNNWPSVSNPATIRILHLDLNDLTSIKATADEFKRQEKRLDVLWNNAGVAGIPVGSLTEQGLEAHVGVNCVAPYLLTQYLLPILRSTAKEESVGSVRVVWTASYMVEGGSPKGGLVLDELEHGTSDATRNYAVSKVGNWLLATETARRYGKDIDNILSVCQNPGNLSTPGWRYQPRWMMLLVNRVLFAPKFGGYTELYAGLSEDLKIDDGGVYIIPWGRKHQVPRADITAAMDEKTMGKDNIATKFWQSCEDKVK